MEDPNCPHDNWARASERLDGDHIPGYTYLRCYGGPFDGREIERRDPSRFPKQIVFPANVGGLLREMVYEKSGDVYLYVRGGEEFTITFE